MARQCEKPKDPALWWKGRTVSTIGNSHNGEWMPQTYASGAFPRYAQAALVNFSDYSDFLDSEEFSDDNVIQLRQQAGNRFVCREERSVTRLC